MKDTLRESTISYLKESKTYGDKDIVFEFIKYLDAYCVELKHTEWDILTNDEHYDLVFTLFKSIILDNRPDLL
jgi:hypothetical protein